MTITVRNTARAHASSSALPPFSTAGTTGSVTLNGTRFVSHALSPAIAAQAKKLATLPMPLQVASFKVPLGALKSAPKGFEKLAYSARTPNPKFDALPADKRAFLTFAHDAMMASDKDGAQFFSKFDPGSEEISVQRIKPADAFKVLASRVSDTQADSATNKKNTDAYRATLASMLHDPNLQVFKAAWDNTDDTDREAIIAVNVHTGEARELVSINPP